MTFARKPEAEKKQRRFGLRIPGRRGRGFTLIETALALGISALVLTSALYLFLERSEEERDQVAAEQLRYVAQAARKYVIAEGTAIATNTTVTPATLIADGYLPDGFSDESPYGQNYRVLIRQVSPTVNDIIVVTTGGQDIDDGSLGRIATLAGAQGGFIADGSTTITGTFGGWTSTTAIWAVTGTTPQEGHLAATLGFDTRALAADYLYRGAIPGQPEANTMRTDLDMGTTNDINNADDVNSRAVTTTENVTAGTTVAAADEVTAGAFVDAATDVVAGQDVIAVRDVTAGRNLNVTSDGSISGNLGVTGTTTSGTNFSGAYFYSSDLNLKTNFRDLNNPLGRLLSLRGLEYQWKKDGNDDMGVIAQDVLEIFPELVAQRTDDGTLAVKYGNLIAPVIEGMRRLHYDNLALQMEIRQLRGETLSVSELQFMQSLRSNPVVINPVDSVNTN